MCWECPFLRITPLTWGGVVQAHQVICPLNLLQAHGLLLLEHAVRVHGGGLWEHMGGKQGSSSTRGEQQGDFRARRGSDIHFVTDTMRALLLHQLTVWPWVAPTCPWVSAACLIILLPDTYVALYYIHALFW